MKSLLRSLDEVPGLWRSWLPLLLIAVALPPFGIALPLVEKQLIDTVLLKHRLDLLPETILTYSGLFIVASGLGIARSLLQVYAGERITLRLRQRLLAHCEGLSLSFWHREHNGRTMVLFQSDVPHLAGLVNSTVVGGLGGLVAIVLGVSVMFTLSWQLAIVAGIVPPVVGGLSILITRPLRPAARRVQEKAAELSERLQENLAGIREIVAFGREELQGRRFATTLQELLRLRMRLIYMDSAIQVGQGAFSLVVSMVILGYGGYLFLRGDTTLGTVLAMRSLFSQLFMTAGQLFGLIKNAQTDLASADRVYAFLDEVSQVRERAGAREPANVEGAVTFDRVNFAYQPDRPVLRDVSFVVQPGELIALVGPSGAGKSTLVSLVSRFYDPTSGRVLLDGTDLRDLTLDGLRRQIGIVFQDTFLFATTIRENIAFGRAGASESEIVEAARTANAWEFIERLPEGLDTPVGQRGIQLSEGQKQRLAIARAVLRNPRILVLDEPTSALDARSEHLLQLALDRLVDGRTTFVIAHRLATVLRADRILVVDEGRIVEQGAHAELLRQRGLYRELYDLQFASAAQTSDGTEAVALAALG